METPSSLDGTVGGVELKLADAKAGLQPKHFTPTFWLIHLPFPNPEDFCQRSPSGLSTAVVVLKLVSSPFSQSVGRRVDSSHYVSTVYLVQAPGDCCTHCTEEEATAQEPKLGDRLTVREAGLPPALLVPHTKQACLSNSAEQIPQKCHPAGLRR